MALGRFSSLRSHSWHSLLEGCASPTDLLERAAAAGYQSLALTDTNSLSGIVDFVEAARRYPVRPIVGACLRHQNQRATALVAEAAGYRSLCRILHHCIFRTRPPSSPPWNSTARDYISWSTIPSSSSRR